MRPYPIKPFENKLDLLEGLAKSDLISVKAFDGAFAKY